MRNCLPCVLLVLVAALTAPTVATETDRAGAREGATRKVLAHYVGHWKGLGRFTGADGETITTPDESGGRFILGGKFVERRSIEATGGTLQIIGFDQRTASYVSWVFGADRATFKASGTWDPRTSTMAWTGTTYREFGFAAEETHDRGRVRGRWQASDSRGRVLVRGTSLDRRAAPTADRKFFEKALRVTPSSSVPQLRPMQDLVGPWRETLAIDVPGRETIRGAGTYAARWVLGGAAQLWRGRRETNLGAEEYLWVFTFDEQDQEHRAWWFSSQGAVVEYVGGRKPGSNVWQWKANGLQAGVRQTITVDATTPSRIESTMEVKRGSSSRGTRHSTATRDASPAN